jgi:transcription elongation GreA/GreB family factor
MALNELMELAQKGDLAGFESVCLDALGGGKIRLAELVPPFLELERNPEPQRVANLGQMVLENAAAGAASDPGSALHIARISLVSDPQNASLRMRVASLYKEIHGSIKGFTALLDASGLETGRPARNAVRMLELCLTLRKGDALLSRTEDVVAEVVDADLAVGVFAVRREGRLKTLTSGELAREYERVSADDFRVLRHLSPAKLTAMVREDPVQVVVGLLRMHGAPMDQDSLKAELSPQFVPAAEWPKWWTSARTALKKCPNVTIEGRSPVILKYSAAASTLEDETWRAFTAQSDPDKWLATVEGYLREKKKDKQVPDKAFLQRCHGHLMDYIKSILDRRPAEALACALVTERLDEECGIAGDEAKLLAVDMLRRSPDPVRLISRLEDNNLWDLGLSALEAADAGQAPAHAAALFGKAPAGLLDRLEKMARSGGHLGVVQAAIDAALAAPVENPEILYWLWKGPARPEGLNLPTHSDLFTKLIGTLCALGRTLTASADATKRFRHRIKAALQLKDFTQVRECMAQIDASRAVTLKTQLNQLDGLGDNTPSRMIDLLRDVHPQLWRVFERRLEAWEDMNTIWTTRAGLTRKSDECETLVNVTMRENAKRIGEAAAMGDLSENSEYKFALEERDLLRARLAQMNNELSIAQPIEPLDVPTDRVGIGSRVFFRDVHTGATRTMTFLGPFDGDPDHGIYNYRAPVAQKCMGLRVGEHVKLQLDDRDTEMEVLRIENGLTS